MHIHIFIYTHILYRHIYLHTCMCVQVINSKVVICYLSHLKVGYIILPFYLLILQFLRITIFSIVNNVITACGARQVLDLLGGPLCKLYNVKPEIPVYLKLILQSTVIKNNVSKKKRIFS